jgi:hypothetical protein
MLTILVPGNVPVRKQIEMSLWHPAEVTRACAGRIQENASWGRWWSKGLQGSFDYARTCA